MKNGFSIAGLLMLLVGLTGCPGSPAPGTVLPDGGVVPGNNNGNGDQNAAAPFFVPTGDEARNTVNPRVEVDANGVTHSLFPAYAVGDAFYSSCTGSCSAPEQMKTVKLETDGTVANAMLAIGPDGKPRALLSTFFKLYYAQCTGDCSQRSGWQMALILEHDGDREVSGEAFALTSDGKPRFMMHVYRALFGIGQKPPASFYAQCDANCLEPASWDIAQVAEEIWAESTLKITADGHAKLATVATVKTETGEMDMNAYAECTDGKCNTSDSWKGIGLYPSYSNKTVERIPPAVSMDLTAAGNPRVLVLGKNDAGKRNHVYFECNTNCSGDNWTGSILNESDKIGAGMDLTLDSKDRPRFVYTADDNILLAFCDERCAEADGKWDLKKVEFGGDIPADNIFLYPNCTVGFWFLRAPSLSFSKDDVPNVLYQAEDISGGVSRPDPTKPGCTAGVDMTLTRFARLNAMK